MDGEDQTRDAEDGDAEIFDDADFYQEMVRDVINTKTGKDGGFLVSTFHLQSVIFIP